MRYLDIRNEFVRRLRSSEYAGSQYDILMGVLGAHRPSARLIDPLLKAIDETLPKGEVADFIEENL